MAGVAVPAQVGAGWVSVLFLLILVAGVLVVVGLVLWGLFALVRSLSDGSGSEGPGATDWHRLSEHPAFDTTERYGDGAPEVETVVQQRRVVARIETAPGGTDRYAVVQTAMLSVKAGTGFELAETGPGRVEYVDRGPDAPSLPEEVRSDLEALEAFGGLTVDDRTGVVEHRFPDPGAVAAPETLRRQAEALVAVAEAVEDHAERARGRAGPETDPAVETGRE